MNFRELLQDMIKSCGKNIEKEDITPDSWGMDWEMHRIASKLPESVIRFLRNLIRPDGRGMILDVQQADEKAENFIIKCNTLSDYQKYADDFRYYLEHGPAIVSGPTLPCTAVSEMKSLEIPEGTVTLKKPQRLLGKGGDASVFLADYTSPDGKRTEVAVKIPHSSLGDAEYYFQREVLIGCCLSHSTCHQYFVKTLGYTKIRDFERECGRTTECQAMVMELMHPENLSRYIHRIKPSLSFLTKLSIAQKITAGIAYLHLQGIVHRDIKPENIFLNIDPSTGEIIGVKIGDLVYATPLERDGTAPGSAGTPPFMAPEVFPDTARYLPASDIYSLAIIFYELFYETSAWPRAYTNRDIEIKVTGKERPAIGRIEAEKIPECIRSDIATLITTGWSQIPKYRPTSQYIRCCLTAIQNKYTRLTTLPTSSSSFFAPPGPAPKKLPAGPAPTTPSDVRLPALR